MISTLYDQASLNDWEKATFLLERVGVPTQKQWKRSKILAQALRMGSSVQADSQTWALAQLRLLAGV